MPLITILLGIAVLLILIIGLRFNAFIALIIVSLGIGVALGLTGSWLAAARHMRRIEPR